MSLLDAFSVWLLVLFYLTGIDVMFIVNINFISMLAILIFYGFHSLKLTYISGVYAALLFCSLLKIIIPLLFGGYDFELSHMSSYFIGLLIPFFGLNLASQFNSEDRELLLIYFKRFAQRYAVIAFTGIIVYFYFYLTGKIVYFGMGSNLHYIFPFFLSKNYVGATFAFLVIVLISGKRSVLVSFLGQCLAFFLPFIRRRPILLIGLALVLTSMIAYLVLQTEIFNRIKLMIDLDWSSPDDLAIILSGRYEEIVGISDYFTQHIMQLYLGAPPGAYYQWIVPLSDYEATKNYSHITVLGYLFRYGVFFSIAIYSYFIYLVIKYRSSVDPFYLVFVGIFLGSFFGANLVIDPLSWIFIGLLTKVSLRNGVDK